MPTFEKTTQFVRDYMHLTAEEKLRFMAAVEMMVADLKAGNAFRASLRIKGVQGHEGIYELTWAGDGRATFSYGSAKKPGEAHIKWRRVGTHSVLKNP